MGWTLHKDNLATIVQTKLQSRQYCHANHLFLDSPFTVAMLKYFPNPDMALAEYEENGEILCAFIVTLVSPTQAGCFISTVSQISAAYICNSIPPAKMQKILKSLFSVLPKSALVFSIGYQDSDIVDPSLYDNVGNCVVDVYGNNTSIPAGADFETYWSQRSKSTRKSIRRAIKKLEKEGMAASYNIVDTRTELQDALRIYGELESAGWKGREGSAIESDNQQGAFYSEVLSAYIDQGRAKVHQLKFDGKVVASLLTIEDEQMNIALKTTYDETYAKYAPGRLLDYYMLQEMLKDGCDLKIENYTNASVEDQKWWPRVRDMYHVTVYRYRWLLWLRRGKARFNNKSAATQ